MSLLELAYYWDYFEGTDTWSWRFADCRAMDGIKCDDDGYVIAILLSNKKIEAPIPDMISQFQHLKFISLMSCQLTGIIPDSLFEISSLVFLDLRGNTVTGTLPTGFSRLARLESIYLNFNQLSGPLEPLCNLPRLQDLDLASNFFNGSIPNGFSSLTLLTYLHIDANYLSGSIPSSFGHMTSMAWLDLSYNLLSGSIPDSLSRMQNLTTLKISTNQLTGPIPSSLGAIRSLINLVLPRNLLSGSIPESLASLQNLTGLVLEFNQLTGSIPAALADLPLWYLSTASNPTSGSMPTAFGKLSKLLVMDLEGNQLHGTIPSTLSNLSKLQTLLLGNNKLSGPVDHILRSMTSITVLSLYNNHLLGRLPCPAPSIMEQYNVENNFFTHGEVKMSNCSAAQFNTRANCLAPSLAICGRTFTQRPATACAAFCGVEVGAARPVCEGHGYCSVNPFIGAGECVCDPNYMLNSTNSKACVAGAIGASLASGSAYLSLRGSASVLSNGSILLTAGTPNQQGAAFASPALRLFHFPDKRSPCGIELAFTAAFSFAMIPGGQGAGGEGLAFVVAAASPGKGASVGLGGVGRRSVGVEFDSVLSVKHSDPNDNHVGVNVGGSPVSLASATAPLILNDAQTKHAWIHYDPTSGGTLRVFLSSDPVQPLTPTLTASVSLCSALKPTASDSLFLFGFVAVSSSQPQAHSIFSWNFTTGTAP
ncbi:hypothetical protein CLOM_g14374 [Closterium sp. NIES-68]|nr:hypothetical protein CLOM_g14374 [Closterium sp. NIES-68]GJP84236.1 hypothetical protein CLOP_g14322 [Closterium sp. NIES-67]